MAEALPRVLLIGGPTASGKTRVAIEVAKRFGAIVLSADAMAVYRGMDIGTAKPTLEERQGVVHEGFDLVAPDEPFDVADFLALAWDCFEKHERVVVVGGTSLYLQAVIRGLVQTARVSANTRAALEALPDLHAALSAVDPVLAARLHPADRVRLIRGLEVFEASGRPLSELQAAHQVMPDRVVYRAFFLDHPELYARIDARVDAMMAAGYLGEVQGLLDRGVSRDAKPMKSLGYRHLTAHLCDELPLEEAVRLTKRDSRHFARKQRTWHNALGWPLLEAREQARVYEAATELWGPAL